MSVPAFSIPDLSGKHAIVTGSNTGIGWCTARRLVAAGADVTLAVRNLAKGKQAHDEILASEFFKTAANPGTLSVLELDVADAGSVAQAATTTLAAGRNIDILVLNAGISRKGPLELNAQGLDLVMATNVWGHFELTARLMPLLRGSRVVTVGSFMANLGSLRPENLNGELNRSAQLRYGTSKLACIAFAKELQRRSLEHGWGVSALAAHPGASRTAMLEGAVAAYGRVATVRQVASNYAQSPEMGCLPIVHAATNEFARGGDYFGPSGFLELSGYPTLARVPRGARSWQTNQRFFDTAEKITGVRFADFA